MRPTCDSAIHAIDNRFIETEEGIMTNTIAIILLSLAAAFSCSSVCAGRDGAQLLHQVQTLQRIKQAASVDNRADTHRPQLAHWDSRRAPVQN